MTTTDNISTDTTRQFKSQLPRNLFLQILSFLTHIIVGLLLTPYLVKHLGRAAYGLVPLAGAMTEYVSIVTQTVSSAVGRFLTIALQRDGNKDANRVFNTAFFSYLALSLLQIPIFGLIIYFANSVFTIPPELYRDAIILLICGAVSFLIGLLCSVFGVPIYANNRLDISRTLDITKRVGRLTIILILFAIYGPALRFVGYADLTVVVLGAIIRAIIGKRFAPELKLNPLNYDWSKLREIVGMGGWLLVNYLGFLLLLRVDIWVCNRFISAEAAGDYAAVLQWSNLIRQAGIVLSGVLGPMIVIYYARSEVKQLVRLSQVSVRVLCLILAIPISILCAFSSSILRLWLGESFSRLAPLMTIMLCHLTINIGIRPLFNINTALNKVKWPGILTCILGIANLLLAIIFAKYLRWGVYGVAIAGGVVLTLKNALFTPIYAAVILKRPWHIFMKSSVIGLVMLAGLTGLGYLMNYLIKPTTLISLAASALILGVIGLVAVWLVLSSEDRRLIIELVPGRFRSLARKFLPA